MSRDRAARIDTPLGVSEARFADNDALVALYFHATTIAPAPRWPAARRLQSQVDAYFAGERQCFDLPMALRGSDFALCVWQATQDVAFGETASYVDIARVIAAPRAARAVGRALAACPVWLVVPCHRVVRADGRGAGESGGYGGNVSRRRALLDHERSVINRTMSAPKSSRHAAAR